MNARLYVQSISVQASEFRITSQQSSFRYSESTRKTGNASPVSSNTYSDYKCGVIAGIKSSNVRPLAFSPIACIFHSPP
jgi:hypothetical protein